MLRCEALRLFHIRRDFADHTVVHVGVMHVRIVAAAARKLVALYCMNTGANRTGWL